jgi:hypothetical protein
MTFRRFLVGVTALLCWPVATFSAPVPKDEPNSGPQITIRVQSAEELAKRATDFLKAALPPELFKMLYAQVGNLDVTQIPLIDPAKPAGFFASFHPAILQGDFKGTQIVFMVPVKGEKETIEFLEKDNVPVRQKDGVYSFPLGSSLPFSFHTRFKNGYAYVGVGTEAAVEENTLIAPNVFFAEKEAAAVVLSVRFDRIPTEIKSLAGPILTAAPLKLNQGLPSDLKVIEKPLGEPFLLLGRWAKQLSDEGRELAIRADLNPKTVTLDLEIAVDGKPKSNLADAIAAYKPSENRFASLVTLDAAAYVVMKFPLFAEELRRGFAEMSKEIGKSIFYEEENGAPKEGGNGGPKEGRELVETFFDALASTIKSGNMDLVATFNGPSKEGTYQAVGAIQFQNTKVVEKKFIAAMKIAPQRVQKIIKWEAEKIGDAVVHEIDFTEVLDDTTKKVFGKTPKLNFSFAEEGVFAAFGSDNLPALKSALSAKRGRQPALDTKIFPKKFEVLLNNLGISQNMGVMGMAFMRQETVTPLKIETEGGDKLKIKISTGIALPAMMGTWALPTRPVPANKPAAPVPVFDPIKK